MAFKSFSSPSLSDLIKSYISSKGISQSIFIQLVNNYLKGVSSVSATTLHSLLRNPNKGFKLSILENFKEFLLQNEEDVSSVIFKEIISSKVKINSDHVLKISVSKILLPFLISTCSISNSSEPTCSIFS